MKRLHDKIVLVTAAGGDIGRLLAEAIAGAGGTVITADPHGSPGAARRLDVTREADWRRLVDRIATEHGRLDGLVTVSSAPAARGGVEQTDLATWRASPVCVGPADGVAGTCGRPLSSSTLKSGS